MDDLQKLLTKAINITSQDSKMETPDFILSKFIAGCLTSLDELLKDREDFLHSTPSQTSIEIAARVWCDQEMQHVTMDTEAAMKIATIIESVLKKHKGSN